MSSADVATVSSENVPQPAPRPAAPLPSLAQKATRGFAWLMLQTVGSKGVAFASEILLARWLTRADFGIRSDAMTVLAFAALLQDYGISQVLVHRQHRFARWANAAFWASVAIGLLGMLVMAVAAPLVARAYAAPELMWMVLILGVRSPVNAIGTVSYAKLQADLHYRTLAIVNFLTALVTAATAVIFAKLGFGAYSFIWPLLISAAARSLMLCIVAPPAVLPKLQLRRWRYLTGQSGLLLAASALFTLTSQGDYMTLGVIYGKTDAGKAQVVGIYFFGFMLCVQTTQFITVSLANVLLPTFSKLQNEPERLKSAFLRATGMLAVVGVFACLLQAAVAAPMIQTLFRPKADPTKWVPAVPILQIISLGMALQLFNMPAQSLIQAQGRFATMLKLAIFCPILFFGLIWLAAMTGTGPVGAIRFAWLQHALDAIFRQPQPVNVSTVVAIAVAVYCLVTGPVCLWVALRPLGGSSRDIWPIYVGPVVTSGLAILIGMVVGHFLPATKAGNWAKLVVVPLVSAAAYAPMVRWTAPRVWADVAGRFAGLLRRRT